MASFDLSDLKKSPTYTITGRFIPFISFSFTLCTLFYDLTRDPIANNFVIDVYCRVYMPRDFMPKLEVKSEEVEIVCTVWTVNDVLS